MASRSRDRLADMQGWIKSWPTATASPFGNFLAWATLITNAQRLHTRVAAPPEKRLESLQHMRRPSEIAEADDTSQPPCAVVACHVSLSRCPARHPAGTVPAVDGIIEIIISDDMPH